MALRRINDEFYVVDNDDQSAYLFETVDKDQLFRERGIAVFSRPVWDLQPMFVPGTELKIIPWGLENKLPAEVRAVMDQAHLPGGIMKKQLQLLWGQGPMLYKLEFKNGVPTKVWTQDSEIENWMKEWDAEGYLMKQAVDFCHMEGCFSKVYRNRGARIGSRPQVVKLEHESTNNARLEWPEDLVNVKAIITANYLFPDLGQIRRYPIFNFANPFEHPVSMLYSNLPGFARDFYNYPSFFGAMPWFKNSGKMPIAINSLLNNAAIIKFHVKSPQAYWDKKKSMLMEQCAAVNKPYDDKMLADLKAEMYSSLAKVLSGVHNIGKFFATEQVVNQFGHLEGWEIITIDQKIKDYVESLELINKMADRATIAGIGLHSALANVSADGKSDSGSEQLYALKIYLATGVDIPEQIVTKALNYAIRANWPSKNLKVGFYHSVVGKEQDVTSSARVTTQV
jgi:hypothetical protein